MSVLLPAERRAIIAEGLRRHARATAPRDRFFQDAELIERGEELVVVVTGEAGRFEYAIGKLPEIEMSAPVRRFFRVPTPGPSVPDPTKWKSRKKKRGAA